MARKGTINKDADTGKIVTKKFAEENPKTTYELEVKIGPVKKRSKKK